jgi:hypothetical protein
MHTQQLPSRCVQTARAGTLSLAGYESLTILEEGIVLSTPGFPKVRGPNLRALRHEPAPGCRQLLIDA